MSLLATLLVVGGGAVVAAVLARRRRRPVAAERDDSASAPASELADFPVALGDVISVGGEEAWLEHGWLLEESGAAVAALLFAGRVIVLALPAPRSLVYWLSALDAPPFAGEPPSSLDLDGEHLERARRLPVAVRALGRAPDPPWDSALLAEYRALGGGVLWMLARGDRALAWRGRRVDDSELENWGRATASPR